MTEVTELTQVATLTEEDFNELPAPKPPAQKGEWDPYFNALDQGKIVRIDYTNDKDRANKRRAIGQVAARRGMKVIVKEGKGFFGVQKDGTREIVKPGRRKKETS